MSVTSEATALWNGPLESGNGTVTLASAPQEHRPVSWRARAEGDAGVTTPEELIGAAHASCFCMAFSNILAQNGTPPERIQATAAVTFKPGTGITGSHLLVSAAVPGLDAETFQQLAEDAKANCPVSVALAGVTITLEASLA
ncbi:MAG: OsmC family peroxiredoxin [Mycetocola sp.]